MDSHNSKLCHNGINILWGLSLLPHLGFVVLLSFLEKNKYGKEKKKLHPGGRNVQRNGMPALNGLMYQETCDWQAGFATAVGCRPAYLQPDTRAKKN